jgi:hypothetical protein
MNTRARLASGAFALGLFALVVALLMRTEAPAPAPAPVEAPVPVPKGYVCHRAARPLVIDGRLEETWADAAWTDDFVDIEGDAKPRPRFRTRVKMLWDDEALYIAAELEEPHVGALLTRHDSYIFHHDNDFEVFLDPDGDGHLYAELEMNALNTTWDLLLTKPYKDGGKAIDAWEIDGLRTAVHVDGTINDARDTDRGWTIEIAWPWRGLKQIASCRVPPQDGDRWRINFSRVQLTREFRDNRYHKSPGTGEENWVWSPQGAVNMHLPERWGELVFSTEPPGTVAFQPDPSGPARRALHRIYNAQATYRRKHGRWARSLGELGLEDLGVSSLGRPRLETTSTRWEASVELRTSAGQVERWHIESDARLWKE